MEDVFLFFNGWFSGSILVVGGVLKIVILSQEKRGDVAEVPIWEDHKKSNLCGMWNRKNFYSTWATCEKKIHLSAMVYVSIWVYRKMRTKTKTTKADSNFRIRLPQQQQQQQIINQTSSGCLAHKQIPKFPLSSLFASKWRSFKRRSTDSAREKGASLNSYQPCKALLYESIVLLLPVGKKSHQKPNMSISHSIWIHVCIETLYICSIKVNMLIRMNIIYTSLSTCHVSKAMLSILVYHDISTHWHCQCNILTGRPSNLMVLKLVSNMKALQQHVSK